MGGGERYIVTKYLFKQTTDRTRSVVRLENLFLKKLSSSLGFSRKKLLNCLKFKFASNTNSEIVVRNRNTRHFTAPSNFDVTLENSFTNRQSQRNASKRLVHVSENNFSSNAGNINLSVRDCRVNTLSAFASAIFFSKSTSKFKNIFRCFCCDNFFIFS